MKFKIATMKEYEVEIENSASLVVLYQWWKTHRLEEWKDCPEDLVDKAVKEVENATGLPFGCDDATETISAVFADNNDAILEW